MKPTIGIRCRLHKCPLLDPLDVGNKINSHAQDGKIYKNYNSLLPAGIGYIDPEDKSYDCHNYYVMECMHTLQSNGQ